jgi:hypothetical protein
MRKLKRLGGIGFPDDPIDPVVQCQAVMLGISGSTTQYDCRNLRARSLLTVYTGSNLCRPYATWVYVGSDSDNQALRSASASGRGRCAVSGG